MEGKRARGGRCCCGSRSGAQMALKRCGLYKFLALKGMKAQVRLLEMLVGYWDLESESFILDGQPLRIEVEYIYFLIGLSCWGEVVNLKSQGAGSRMKIEEYIDAHCVAGTPKVGSQLPIRAINNIILKIVVLMLNMITRSTSLHQASRPLMFYVVKCLRPIVYDWCTSLLENMKSQLIECKQGSKMNFGFASILCSFFFEWVPSLAPRVDILPRGPRDPTMAWWTEVMRRQRGGRVPTPYNEDFFYWWKRQVIALDDYPYAGIDFRGDPDMPLPPGTAYGDIGMSKCFELFHFFVFLYTRTKIFLDGA
jgi:hypothetical protein